MIEFRFCPEIQQYDVKFRVHFVSIMLCLDVGKNNYIILCNFGGRSMSGCEVTERGSRSLPTVAGNKNSLF